MPRRELKTTDSSSQLHLVNSWPEHEEQQISNDLLPIADSRESADQSDQHTADDDSTGAETFPALGDQWFALLEAIEDMQGGLCRLKQRLDQLHARKRTADREPPPM
ncbi:MAG TPA: hypothetical protein VG797_05480 [Phycisphaerales bacterium]|nr:hypothetical protein [Phycisphaerales bacterium]